MADVDAQFHGCRGHEHLQLSGFQLLFGRETMVAAHAAVMGADHAFAEPFAESEGQTFRQAAGVDEDQGGVMRENEFDQALIQFLPDLGAHHGGQRRTGHFNRNFHVAPEAGVDDLAIEVPGRGIACPCARQELRDCFHGLLRRRQADALQGLSAGLACKLFQPFDGKREVRAALVAEHGVNLVDDQCRYRGEHGAAAGAGQQQIEGFGSSHQDMRRMRGHLAALVGGSIAGANRNADFGCGVAAQFGDAGKRNLQVPVYIVIQRFQRGHIQNLYARAKLIALAHEPVETRIERGQGLAASGRRRDQCMTAPPNRGPGIGLRRSR